MRAFAALLDNCQLEAFGLHGWLMDSIHGGPALGLACRGLSWVFVYDGPVVVAGFDILILQLATVSAPIIVHVVDKLFVKVARRSKRKH